MKGHVKLGNLPDGKWSWYRFDGRCTLNTPARSTTRSWTRPSRRRSPQGNTA